LRVRGLGFEVWVTDPAAIILWNLSALLTTPLIFGFTVKGKAFSNLGFRVKDLGFRVGGLWFRV
jgi:hypothetical protein